MLGLAAAGMAAENVDFSYAFAPPHRMTVGQPGASEKTLLDVEPGALTIAWTYEDLRAIPLAVWKPPRVAWKVKLKPALDGKAFAGSEWRRAAGGLPELENTYRSGGVSLKLEAAGAVDAALVRITVRNGEAQAHRVTLPAEVQGGWVAHNPAWVDRALDGGSLVAMQHERADRVLLFAVGLALAPSGPKVATLEWNLAPGEERTGWLVRPYRAYLGELPALRRLDYAARYAASRAPWNLLLARAVQVELPDARVREALLAGLADLFIMREPLAEGYTGTLCGTDIYRSTNPFEPALAAIALDQFGLHAEAADGLRVHLDMQEPDGNWADPHGWARGMWGASGMKAWAAMEHYRLTRDRKYLEAVYPRMQASSRWQHGKRAGGLMPRGMGDGGLMNGADYFGVFYPHNLLAVFADRLAAEAAELLEKREEAAELRGIYESAWTVLRREMSGTGNLNTGSVWGALFPAFPTGLMAPDDPYITATLASIERKLSPGGHPVHTGWMADGLWAAITLDNLAEVHLLRDEGDTAAAYLYATLNHATPLFTWCEERGVDPGSKKISGDLQHLWTPLAVVRYLRDALVMEQGGTLHLARGTARSWLEAGKTIGIKDAPTHFGKVSYRITAAAASMHADVDTPGAVLHLRHARRAPIQRVTVDGAPWSKFNASAETVSLAPGRHTVEVYYHKNGS